MRRISTLPGVWPLMLLAVVPLLVAGVASAAPGYPVEEPTATDFTVAYDPASDVMTLSTPLTDQPDDTTSGVATETDEVSVGGPNGQINHGQIVRQVHDLVDGPLLGCVTRTVAQSDLGKGDQQVRPHEQPTTSDATALVDPLVLEGECTNHPPSDKPAPGSASEHRPESQDKAQNTSVEDVQGKNK